MDGCAHPSKNKQGVRSDNDLIRGRNFYRGSEAAIHRTPVDVYPVHALYRFANVIRCPKRELRVNPANHEHAIFGFDLSPNVCRKTPITRIDLARLQRAPEGSEHSASGRSHHIIDSGRMRFREFGLVDTIVLCDRAMHAERDRTVFARQLRDSQGALLSFKAHMRYVNDGRHVAILHHVDLEISVEPLIL